MAVELPADEVIKAIGGILVKGDDPFGISCHGATTDSRKISSGGMFFARSGEDLNGHSFIGDALARGASMIVIEDSWLENGGSSKIANIAIHQPYCIIKVGDSTKAIGKLASYWRNFLNIPTLAITGSVGKTTTKEIAASILLTLVGQGTAAKKSFNNKIGLPETILESSVDDKWLLLEAGMNHPGELDYLSRIASPNFALINNVGPAHLEHFASIEEIADAKCEILNHLKLDGSAVINCSDKILNEAFIRAVKRLNRNINKVTFGLCERAEFQVKHIKSMGILGEEFEIIAKDQVLLTSIPKMGIHNVVNASAACALVLTAYPYLKLADITEALRSSTSQPMRLENLKIGNLTVINDCYNANPISMEAAINVIKNLAQKRKFALVLGDMLELGDKAEAFHYSLGELVGNSGASKAWLYGNYGDFVKNGAKSVGFKKTIVVRTFGELVDDIISEKSLELLLFKASRGIMLEKAIDLLKEKNNVISSTLPTTPVFFSS